MPARAARLWARGQPAGAPRVHSDAGAGGPPASRGTSAKVDGLRLDARFCAGTKGAPNNARNIRLSGALGGISSQSDQTGNQFS